MNSPFKGLVPFDEDDQRLFAGRETEIKLIITKLYGSALTVLYGESGVGKTSLIWAGVLPELRKKEHRVAVVFFREWQSAGFETILRDEILKALLLSINQLKQASKDPTPLTFDQLRQTFTEAFELANVDDLYSHSLPLDRFISECSAAFQGRMFFIFDQFEEYIYYHPLEVDGRAFDTVLARAVNDRSIAASFLISLREDGLGKLDRLRGRIPDLLGNLIKIEHLSQDGARQSIRKQLKIYGKENALLAEASQELTDVLLDQINVNHLEMDDIGGDGTDEDPKTDGGVRYKALALQAVLTQLWEEKASRRKTAESIGKVEAITLTLTDLQTLVEGKKNPHETEARYIIRTYFDDRLKSLNETEIEHATEIFRGLVRAGGHKRARSADTLSKEAGIATPFVERLLEKLASPPIDVLRKLKPGKIVHYELHHDVMAFALMDWSTRQRQLKQQKDFAAAEARRLEQSTREQEEVATRQRLREKELEVQALEFTAAEKEQEEKAKQLERRKKFALMQLSIAILAMVVTGILIWISISSREKEVARREMNLMREREWNRTVQRLIDQSLAYLGTANQFEFKPKTALLAAVDAIAEHRAANAKHGRTDIFVPSEAVLALAIAREAIAVEKKEEIPMARAYPQVPSVQSADGKSQLALKAPKIIELRIGDKPVEFSFDSPITTLGFDPKATQAGVGLQNGQVIIWHLPNVMRDEPKDGASLATKFNADNEAASARRFRFGPENGWERGYSETITEHLLNALKAITGPYPQEDRDQIGVPKHVVTDEINAAYEDVRNRRTEKAIATLEKALSQLFIDKAQAKPVLAASLFRYATEPSNIEKREEYFNRVVELDDSLKTTIQNFNEREKNAKSERAAIALIESAKKLAAEEKVPEAEAAYEEAIKLDSSLKHKVSLPTLIEAGKQTKAIKLMNEGNELAKRGDRNAIEKYEEAIKLDPTLKEKVIPENEYKRFAEGSTGLPRPDQSPPPQGPR